MCGMGMVSTDITSTVYLHLQQSYSKELRFEGLNTASGQTRTELAKNQFQL